MDFIASALQAIPAAAIHPYALIAYLAAILSWVVLGLRISRNRQLLDNLEKLPEKDRLSALRDELGYVQVPRGFTASDWLKQRRQQFYLIAFISLMVVAVVVFTIAISSQSTVEKSRSELVQILELREQKLSDLFYILLINAEATKKGPLTENGSFDVQKLIQIRDETMSLISKRREALTEGNLVLAHELGNKINSLSKDVTPLIQASAEHVEKLEEMVRSFSGLHPAFHASFEAARTDEKENLAALQEISSTLSIEW